MPSRDPAVFILTRDSRCYGCDAKLAAGQIINLKNNELDKEVYCLTCAGLQELEMLPPGNQKLTKLAGKYSQRRYVVMKWSDTWKCYERQGLLVEPQAIQKAKLEIGLP